MRIGELARRAGVNIETVRYYERRGLLPEPVRAPSGHRHYDDSAVRFVRAVKESQRLGFTLAEVEDYVRLAARSGARAPEAVRVRAAAKIDEIDARIAALRRRREELARLASCACDSLDHCTCGAGYLARAGHDADVPPETALHVTNGGSTAVGLRATSLGGTVLPWQDVLHEGPVPHFSAARLREVRARFLAEHGWGTRRSLLESFQRRDRLLARALHSGRRIVLWFEHDVYDQLQLVQVLATMGARFANLELVDVGGLVARDDFVGLGALAPEVLESLWPSRSAVAAAAVELAVGAWEAFRAPEPTALEALLAADTEALPFLRPTLERLLEELPAVGSGLSRLERQLLEPLADAPSTPAELFAAAAAREDAPFCGDTWAWSRLAALASGHRPLLTLAGGAALPPPPPLGDSASFPALRLDLTRAGRDVLSGRADAIDVRGIDRWLGGTHLRPGRVWRWDPEHRRIVRGYAD